MQVLSPLNSLLNLFQGPQRLIQKRNDKCLDYDRWSNKIDKIKDRDKLKAVSLCVMSTGCLFEFIEIQQSEMSRSETETRGCSSNIQNTKKLCLATFPNTEKRIENTTRSRVFLRNFEVFRDVVKHIANSMLIEMKYPSTITVMISFV